MAQTFARLAQRLCCLIPSLALMLGVTGYLVQLRIGTLNKQALDSSKITQVSPAFLQIDKVLARRLPDLGLALRQRVAEAVVEESRRANFDPLFVLGLIEVESSFSGGAISWAGARGLMQFLPATLEYVASLEGYHLTANEIWRDPAMQVRLGIRYLSRMEKQFHSLDLALMAYNAGPENVKIALGEGDPNRFGNYVRAVRLNHARFRKKLGASPMARADTISQKPLQSGAGVDMALMP